MYVYTHMYHDRWYRPLYRFDCASRLCANPFHNVSVGFSFIFFVNFIYFFFFIFFFAYFGGCFHMFLLSVFASPSSTM